MILTLEQLALDDGERLYSSLTSQSHAESLAIRIATDMLCNERSPADAAFDWLAVLMLGEKLIQLDCEPSWSIVGTPERVIAVDFTLGKPLERDALNALQVYAQSYLSFHTDGSHPEHNGNSPMFDYGLELLNFEDDIKYRVTHFNDIATKYTACYISMLRQTYLGADYVTMLGRHQLRLKKWLNISALRCSA